MKKLTALILGGVMAGSLLVPLAACNHEKKTALPEWGTNVTLTSNGAEVRWDEVDGAEQYEIYYSPSRFGNYALAETRTVCNYTNADKYGYFRVNAVDGEGTVLSSELYSYEIETFGGNTRVYSDEDDRTLIDEDIAAFRDATGQFYDGRFAALFKAGDYSDLDLRIRYYMTFSGMDYLPTGVKLGGFYSDGELAGGNSTCNFWYGIDNITVNSDVKWAVSQATSFRRMKVNGNLTLHDTGNTPYASGGFISDTLVTGNIDGSVQQQWFTRNSKWDKWSGSDINMVFSGCEGSFFDKTYVWPTKRITELETTNVMSEKPYLVFDDGYYVCLPALQKNSKGISWDGNGAIETNGGDRYIPLSEFYVASADRDNADTLNAALENGKHILLTAGIYNIDRPVLVENPDTVIMGVGLATLRNTSKNSDTVMRVGDVDGVRLSGIMFDAGPQSECLLQIGTHKTAVRHEDNPIVLNDVYYRIGGAGSAATSVDVTLEINCNDVVGDNFWVWRADHGNAGTVGWDINKTKNGVIVNGDHVTVYGLMVEHFHEYQTIWNGEYGFMAFYQSETPYDVPSQSADRSQTWMSEWNGTQYEGYASYKVADGVVNHTAYGLGVYYVASSRLQNVFNLGHAIELPSNGGIRVEHMAIANFLTFGNKTDNGGIRHIVNEEGESLYNGSSKKQYTSFIAGEYRQ